MNSTFDFSEALSFMKSGLSVKDPNGRIYAIEGDELVCYPKPVDRPKQRRIEVKLNVEAVMSNNWSLYENETTTK